MSSVLFGLEARIVQPTAVNSSRSEAEVLQLLSTAGLSLKETIVVHSSVVRVKLAPSIMAVLRPGLFRCDKRLNGRVVNVSKADCGGGRSAAR